MKSFIILLALFFLFGCITPYEPRGIDEVAGILVVYGIITDDESVITLSRSRRLTDDDWTVNYIWDARVYVERDDGTLFPAELLNPENWWETPRYVIRNGTLDTNSRYRLRIEIDEVDFDSDDCYWVGDGWWGQWVCPTNTFEYFSEFSYPIITPEIDSVFWMKRGRGQPVTIHVATHSPNREVLFYRWSFSEVWEINSERFHEDFPFRCWNFSFSREILLGSAERTIFGRVTEIIHEIEPWNRRLSVLYRIDVTQNAISKRAHDYFENIRRNSELTGSIFAPIPSELRGNIFSATDPSRYVIGFIDVSTTTRKRMYISRQDRLYEPLRLFSCTPKTRDELCEYHDIPGGVCGLWDPLAAGYVVYENLPGQPPTFVQHICVDCTFFGTTQRPDDWPN